MKKNISSSSPAPLPFCNIFTVAYMIDSLVIRCPVRPVASSTPPLPDRNGCHCWSCHGKTEFDSLILNGSPVLHSSALGAWVLSLAVTVEVGLLEVVYLYYSISTSDILWLDPSPRRMTINTATSIIPKQIGIVIRQKSCGDKGLS